MVSINITMDVWCSYDDLELQLILFPKDISAISANLYCKYVSALLVKMTSDYWLLFNVWLAPNKIFNPLKTNVRLND